MIRQKSSETPAQVSRLSKWTYRVPEHHDATSVLLPSTRTPSTAVFSVVGAFLGDDNGRFVAEFENVEL